jgi:hypothetical protein
MNKLISLPIEAILEIRKFLYRAPIFSRKLYDYNDFIEKENCWSWRNFLSVSNRQEWRAVRKHAMIWSLNRYETKKYLEDDVFRSNLDHLIMGSKQKMQLILLIGAGTYLLS